MDNAPDNINRTNSQRANESTPWNPQTRVHSREGSVQRPSRDSILQSYAAQDAARARNTRMRSQVVSQYHQENTYRVNERAEQRRALAASQREQREAYEAQRRAEVEAQRARRDAAVAERAARSGQVRSRVVAPLSSQESYERARTSQEGYERARASRDALSEARRSRTMEREVIDARGSVDSRAFNETNQLVGYSEERDRPRAAIDASMTKTRWHSRSGQGFESAPVKQKTSPLSLFAGLPLPVKIGVPVLIVAVAVLAYMFVLK